MQPILRQEDGSTSGDRINQTGNPEQPGPVAIPTTGGGIPDPRLVGHPPVTQNPTNPTAPTAPGAPTTTTPTGSNPTGYYPTGTPSGYPTPTGTRTTTTSLNLSRYNTDPALRSVQGDETVEGRLSGLMRGDNELIRIARENANFGASERGLMGSSIAAGAAERAARETALPIAQQDAAWYGQTAKDNMDAKNRDLLADQEMNATLYGQEVDRNWRSGEAALGRAHDLRIQSNDQSWKSGEAEADRQLSKSNTYFQMTLGRESNLAGILQGIYSNPNMDPSQQAQAADNARQMFSGLWESSNRTFAEGIPQIFWDPYQMTSGSFGAGGGSGSNSSGSSTGGSNTGSNNALTSGIDPRHLPAEYRGMVGG